MAVTCPSLGLCVTACDVADRTKPQFPVWQDCHEMWSKNRRRQLRDQQEEASAARPERSAEPEPK